MNDESSHERNVFMNFLVSKWHYSVHLQYSLLYARRQPFSFLLKILGRNHPLRNSWKIHFVRSNLRDQKCPRGTPFGWTNPPKIQDFPVSAMIQAKDSHVLPQPSQHAMTRQRPQLISVLRVALASLNWDWPQDIVGRSKGNGMQTQSSRSIMTLYVYI